MVRGRSRLTALVVLGLTLVTVTSTAATAADVAAHSASSGSTSDTAISRVVGHAPTHFSIDHVAQPSRRLVSAVAPTEHVVHAGISAPHATATARPSATTSAGAVAPRTSVTPVPSCPATGSTRWTGSTNDEWETAANWSNGVPNAHTYACITASGALVTVNATDVAQGVLLGTGDKLTVVDGSLTLAAGTTPSAVQGALTIDNTDSLLVSAGGTMLNATGGTITVAGPAPAQSPSSPTIFGLLVQGEFQQGAGTVEAASGDLPVYLQNGATLVFAGTGAGSFQYLDSTTDAGTVTLTGDIASTQSLSFPAEDWGDGDDTETLAATASFTNAGTLTFGHAGYSENGSTQLTLPAGDTFTNTGTVDVSGGPDAGSATNDNRQINGNLLNEGTIDVGVSGQPTAFAVLDAGNTLTNEGQINVANTDSLLVSAAVTTPSPVTEAQLLNATGGTITVAGPAPAQSPSSPTIFGLLVQGEFQQGAGTVEAASGDLPVYLQNGATLVFAGTGAGSFQYLDSTTDAGTVTLTGDIASTQSLSFPAEDWGDGDDTETLAATASFTNAGTLTFGHAGYSENGSTQLTLPAGDTFTNTGTVDVSGGPDAGSATNDNRNLDADVVNAASGTINVGVSGLAPGYLSINGDDQLTNDGTINVAATNTLAAPHVDNEGGVVTVLGTYYVQDEFTQGAGQVATAAGDAPVDMLSGSTLTFAGSGAGDFLLYDPTTDAPTMTLSGNLAAGQGVDLSAEDNGDGDDTTVVTATGSFTNAGTIAMSHAGDSVNSAVALELPSGDTLTNAGLITVTGDPNVGSVSSNYQTIDGTVVNTDTGAIDVGLAGKPAAYFIQPAGLTWTNDGTIETLAATGITNTAASTLVALGALDNDEGTITNNGVVESTVTFDEGSGTTVGSPVTVASGNLNFLGSGSSSFQAPAGASPNLTGNLASGQALTVVNNTSDRCGGTVVTAATSFTNAGTITMESAQSCGEDEFAVVGTITNSGEIDFSGAGTAEIDATVLNEATGAVVASGGGTANLVGTTTNIGTFTVAGGILDPSSLTNMVGNTLTGGTYEVAGSGGATPTVGALELSTYVDTLAATLVLGPDGTVSYAGYSQDNALSLESISTTGDLTLESGATLTDGETDFENAGTIDLQPDATLYSYNYIQDSTGTLAIGVAGEPGTGEYGVLSNELSTTLAGTLAIDTADGFVPAAADDYPVLIPSTKDPTAATVSGTFAVVTGATINAAEAYETQYTDSGTTAGVSLSVVLTTAELTTSAVSAPSSVQVGQTISTDWTVDNVGLAAAGSWSDAVYLSPTPSVAPDAEILGTADHSGGLANAGSYSGQLSATVPGLLPGTYYVVIVADANDAVPDADADAAVAASAPVSVTIETLAVGASTTGSISANGDAYVQVTPTAGTNVVLTATFSAASTGSLFESVGAIPSPESYDHAASDLSGVTQDVTLIDVPAGADYVDLENPTTSPVPFTLTATAVAYAISSVTPPTSDSVFYEIVSPPTICNAGGACAESAPEVLSGPEPDITLTVNGAGFTQGSTASLSCTSAFTSPTDLTSKTVTLVSGGQLYIDFGPAPAPYIYQDNLATVSGAGYECALTVTTGDESTQLARAVTINADAQLVQYTGWQSIANLGLDEAPDVTLSVPSINRPNQDTPVLVTYINPYPYDIPAPLLNLSATGATLHYAGEPAGDATNLMLLGVGPTGDPGVLAPGATGTVEAVFDSTVGGEEDVDFDVGVMDDPSGTIDLGDILASMLPPGTPSAVSTYVASTVGNIVTGATLQSELDSAATYLSLLGENVSNVNTLLAYLLAHVTNYGQVVVDHLPGPFGPDNPGLAPALTTDAAGDVYLTIPDGVGGTFAALPAGGYASPAGSDQTLVSDPTGGWTLSSPDGEYDTFNGAGQITAASGANGLTTYTYNDDAELTSIISPEGETQTMTYDTNGEVTSITDSVTGQTETFTYNAAGEMATVTARGETTSFTWNSSTTNEALDGTPASVTFPGGTTLADAYDTSGRLTAVTDDGASVESVSYNADGTESVTDGSGDTTVDYPNENGDIVRVILPSGQIDSETTNAAGEPSTISYGSATVSLNYDALGDLTTFVDPGGRTYTWQYNDVGELTGYATPDGEATTIGVNGAGEPASATDPLGATTTLTYDANGNVTEVTTADGETIDYTYDAAGQLVTRVADGVTTTYTYDGNGDLTSATGPSGATTYAYDDNGRLTGVTYPTGLGLTYTYDAAGRESSVTTSDGFTVGYTYNGSGQLASITNAAHATVSSYTYTADGQLGSVSNANGTGTTYTYDDVGNIASVTNTAGGATTSQYTYTHNALGEATQVVGPAGTTTYAYDNSGDLTEASLPGGRTITYAYNGDGDRTEVTDTTAGTTTYNVNADDAYTTATDDAATTTYTYDADGNLVAAVDGDGTTSYSWTPEGQLASTTSPTDVVTTYGYDALGDLISETTAGTTTLYLPNPLANDVPLGTYSAAGAAIDYYPVGVGQAGITNPAGSTSFFGFDGGGDVTDITGSSGSVTATYQYLPFGALASTTGSPGANPFTFGGQLGLRSDAASGLVQAGFRYYDPAVGRFISQDPTTDSAANPYEYANNDPVDNIDTTGHAASSFTSTINTITTNAGWVASGVENVAAGVWTWGASVGGAATNSLGTFYNSAEAIAGANAINAARPIYNASNYLGGGLSLVGAGLTAYSGQQKFNQQVANKDYDGANQTLYNTAVDTATDIALAGGVLASAPASLSAGVIIAVAQQARDHWIPDYYAHAFDQDPSTIWGNRVGLVSITKTSHDPNEMIGPAGYGPHGYVKGDTPLSYEVAFANVNDDGTTTGLVAVQHLTVTETLDPNLDLATFSLGAIGFGDVSIVPPAGLRSYRTTVNDVAATGLDVAVTADLDTATRTVTWTFSSIDPATGLATTDASAGFLPPDSTPPYGEGYVSYTVSPLATATTGTAISANANVVFDTNAPVSTATVTNTIDNGTPSAKVEALPIESPTKFPLRWTGTDVPHGSGIAGYTVWVSNDGGPMAPWRTDTTATSGTFVGTAGHTYSFMATAIDHVGNTPTIPVKYQAFTKVLGVPTITKITPTSGADRGGIVVTLFGTNLIGATAVHLGSHKAKIDKIVSAKEIRVTVPPGTGTVTVTVTTAGGTSKKKSVDRFTYARKAR